MNVPNTVANVVTGKPLSTGGILIAPTGTSLPTTPSTAPDAAFIGAGYIGEDGVTESNGRTVEKVKAWGGDVVKILQTEHTLTYAFTFIESLNQQVLESVYGEDNVDVTPGSPTAGTISAVELNSSTLPHKSYVLEVKDGDAKVRIVIPDGQISEVGDTTYSDTSVIAYPVTVECFPDANGNKAYKYMDDGVFIP